MLTSVAAYLESTLTLHMVAQHLLFIAAGFLVASGFDSLILAVSRISTAVSRAYALLLEANARMNKRGVVAFLVAALLTVYWHIPGNFDAAVLNEGVHVEMHSAFLIVGGLVFIGSKLLTKRMRQFAPIIAGKGMGLFGAFLLVTPSYIYPVYPAWEQSEAGLVMVVMMVIMDLTIAPYWLYSYFGKSPV
jgi:cytochrome c oxidase assembly factor CtaG